MVFKNGKTEPTTQTVPTTTTTTTEENKETVYITKYGNRYHTPNCFLARDKGVPVDKEAAEGGGYKPCKFCMN